MPFAIVRDDIVCCDADAIVNAANEQLRMGGGVCGAIFRAAGAARLQRACDKIGYCPTGSAVATPGFDLPARYVIHTVGPIWSGGMRGERELLASCYRSSLELAESLGCTSIAFPLISAGIYGYPRREALAVARESILAFLETHEMQVTLVLFDAHTMAMADDLRLRVECYIDDVYVGKHARQNRRLVWEQQLHTMVIPREEAAEDAEPMGEAAFAAGEAFAADAPAPARERKRHGLGLPQSLKRLLTHLDAGFSETLLTLIDERGLTDAQVYKKANLSRQHFSKIRSNPDYRPTKATVLALAVALRLSLDETQMLLERAGFALSHADRRDIIVEFFIKEGIYDVFQINDALFSFDQPLLR